MAGSSILAFHKPFGVITQFTPHPRYRSLAEFGFPKNVYPIGRLDADSEGLLLLTDDGMIAHCLLEPRFRHKRTYWVQVEGVPNASALRQLGTGIVLDGIRTQPAIAVIIPIPDYPERSKPIRFRKTVPTTWIQLTLTEGRNRQVRRMTAAVGHPTLRLVRSRILSIDVASVPMGTWRKLNRAEVERLRSVLGLKDPAEPR
jgi:23S rRNA pseudouridine2457 synthase